MPDLIDLVLIWKKQILAVVIVSLVAVGTVTFLQHRQYLSVATAIPSSSFSADKSRVFNENIEALYSTLGTPDDLDLLLGTANLDTVYLAVTDQFNLFDHFKMAEKGDAARSKAASLLKNHTKVMKSGYGELKVKVWDTDRELAPQLANAIVDKLNAIHQDLQAEGNREILNSLLQARKKTSLYIDSMGFGRSNPASIFHDTISLSSAKKQLQQYDQLIGEYQLIVDTKPMVLVVVEKARASAWPDKPRKGRIMMATLVFSFLFALFAALIMERRKITRL